MVYFLLSSVGEVGRLKKSSGGMKVGGAGVKRLVVSGGEKARLLAEPGCKS